MSKIKCRYVSGYSNISYNNGGIKNIFIIY